MAAYLDVTHFKVHTLMPSADVDLLETQESGWLAQILADDSTLIDARLAKRYATPFPSDSIPLVVLRWLAALVTPKAFLKRGVNPSDAQFALVQKYADDALAEMKEAADSVTGLYDLPLRADTPGTTGISKGFPHAYSEQSPYVWTDGQVLTAADEDAFGSGTTR